MNKSILVVAVLAVVALVLFGCTQPQNPTPIANQGAVDMNAGSSLSDQSGGIADTNSIDTSLDSAAADLNSLSDTSAIDIIDVPDLNGLQ